MGCEIEALSEETHADLPPERDNPHAVKNYSKVEVNSEPGSLLIHQHICDKMATEGLDMSELVENPNDAAEQPGEGDHTHRVPVESIDETDHMHHEPVESIDETDVDSDCGETNTGEIYENVKGRILELEEIKNRLETQCTDIPPVLLDVSLNCLKPSTMEYLSYHLDPESDVLSSDGLCKDYRGLAEWIGLESVFIKFVSRGTYVLKTREVLSKWLTLEEEPLPTIRNLRKCLLSIDRPDVLEDISIKIARDAVSWEVTKYGACMKKHAIPVDTSWQLTRHDVVYGKKTMYTACLLYADEDELMAQLITKLYRAAYKHALFFLPQFDLKTGKYELDTTARVIDERCNKKVVILLSEYFYASNICQFAVNYAAAHGTGHGNLIPFHLTRNIMSVPNVLKGIAGIRWFRKGTRHHAWGILTDSLLADKIEDDDLLVEIKEKIIKLVEKDKENYLQDPPYDDDVKPPGEPIEVIEPEGSSSMPPLADFEYQRLKMEEELAQRKRNKWKFFKQIKRAILEKLLPSNLLSTTGPCSPPRETPLVTFKITEIEHVNTKNKTGSLKSVSETKPISGEAEKLEDSQLGAVGGSGVEMRASNDRNTESHRKSCTVK